MDDYIYIYIYEINAIELDDISRLYRDAPKYRRDAPIYRRAAPKYRRARQYIDVRAHIIISRRRLYKSVPRVAPRCRRLYKSVPRPPVAPRR